MQNYNKAERKLAARPLPPLPAQPRVIRITQKNPEQRVQTDLAPGLRNRGREAFLGENVTFDEYIQDINGSVAFAATKFAVQPGIAATFPKGAIKAALYSEWKMVSCEFYFKPEVSQFAGQGSTGKVILAMDYNAANPAPTTKQQVEIMHVEDAMPYNIIRLRLDASCVNKADSKYIRTGPAPVDEDLKTYDGGNLWVCTIGQAGAGLVGELHARYNFRCTKPTLLNPAQGGLLPQTSLAVYTQHAAETFVTTVPKAIVFDTQLTDGIPVGAPSVAGVFTPVAGNYLVTVNASLQDTTAEAWSVIMELQKNNASLSTPVKSDSEMTVAGINTVVCRGFISCSGSDTVRVLVTMVGEAGPLTSVADCAQISFQAL
jgi:hypothetical protein